MIKTKYTETIKTIIGKREEIDKLYDEASRIEITITTLKDNASDAIKDERASLKNRMSYLKTIEKTIKNT